MYRFRKYVVGSHSARVMVPGFWKLSKFQLTILAVDVALRQSGHFHQMTKQHRLGLAAYVFYQRCNRCTHLFAGGSGWRGHDQYLNVGIYPVDPDILSRVRFSTIVKYANLLYGVQK